MKRPVKSIFVAITFVVAYSLMYSTFTREGAERTSELTIFEQYAKAINEAAPYVQLNDSTFSNHSDSGYVAVQQDVYLQSFQTLTDWEGLMKNGVVQSITSQYYEGAHTVGFVNSIAEWESGPANNFTIAISGYCRISTTPNELKKRAPRNDRFSIGFTKMMKYMTAFNTVTEFIGNCVDTGRALNEGVTYLNESSRSQRLSLFYGTNCYERALQVWVDAWQDSSFTGTDFSSIFVDYGSTNPV